jgi:hypothetical protein
MKTLLWLTAAVGAVAATAAAVYTYRHRDLLAHRTPLALAGGPALEVAEAQIIEIVPLEVNSGPMILDAETERMLEALSDRAMFLR